MVIVLRNNTTRQDAVYILIGTAFRDNATGTMDCYLMAYWGRWATFERTGTTDLHKQEKHHGSCLATLKDKTRQVVTAKLSNGYKVQEHLSNLPQWPIVLFGQSWREAQSTPRRKPR